MNNRNKIILISIATLGVLLGILITNYKAGSGKAKTHIVTYNSKGFNPSTLTVAKGDRIEFKNETKELFWPASDPHPLHSLYPEFDPKEPVDAGSNWTFKPVKTGVWKFHDHLFPSNRGVLTVLSSENADIAGRVLKRDEIKSLISKKGTEDAYSYLKSIYDPSTSFAHSTFHLFGELLFDKLGTRGIELCDNFGGFGCYHGLFVKAVAQRGIETAVELDRICVEKFGVQGLGCPHGIGHGLVEYFGLGKVNEALSVCQKLSWKGMLFGCQGGVFMENNFPTIFDKEGIGNVQTREAHGNLLQPCLDVDPVFRPACYFEQASWWNNVLKHDFQKIGNFCNSLKNQNEYESCLMGAGNTAAETSHYNKESVVDSCKQVYGTKSQALCRAGGSWAFFANPEKRNESESLCTDLGIYSDLCLSKRVIVK